MVNVSSVARQSIPKHKIFPQHLRHNDRVNIDHLQLWNPKIILQIYIFLPYCKVTGQFMEILIYRIFQPVLYISAVNFVSQNLVINPYPTAFPYGNGMVLHFYQQQESSTTKTVHKVINKGLKTYV